MINKISYGYKLILFSLPVFITTALIIYTISYTAFVVYAVSVFLISLIIFLITRRDFIRLSDIFQDTSYKLNESAEETEDYEEKIQTVIDITDRFTEIRKNFSHNKDIDSILRSTQDILSKLHNELNTAKVFKVNRNEFLGNVAHEMRTPIFAIQLSLETLVDGAIHDDNVNMDFLNKAFNQSNRLKNLVDDLINISRLEAGMKLSKRYFSINGLITETINELTGIAKKKHLNVCFEPVIKDSTLVFGDSERIKQVLINLIDNSVKHTPERGNIKLATRKEDKNVFISIEDTGAGIPEEDLPRIFERFYRVDKNRSRDMGGSGLGLSIVKHILELHGTSITVESVYGKGTKFEFSLPS
ncbi:MAG: ATP-binding protein [Ignavibacteria bacterium]|nr:ATP-binding protein [Ignavibacteria bacterium]